jgi:hypothetical protein
MGRSRQERSRDMQMFEPQVYVITVQGELESSWSDRLGGMAITVHHAPDGPLTILTGELADQAALQGILKAVYDLGLPVVSVTSA